LNDVLPAQTGADREERDTFLALMWALSYPGRVTRIDAASTHSALLACGRALLDLETTFYTSDDALELGLRRTGALHTDAASARFLYFDALTSVDLSLLDMLSVGSFEHPDDGATLFIGCELNREGGDVWSLAGPGIATEQVVSVSGLPRGFSQHRESRLRFPLGIDIFLIDAGAIIGLPRTTAITQCM
jgi:alpha-D-ribose 1-methylphosphonate 5-triphosphate synthase subunit PhnH